MLVTIARVDASIARARRTALDPAAAARALADGAVARPADAEAKRRRFAALLAQAGREERAHALLERLIDGNDLVGVNYLELGTLVARSVCRLHLRDATGATAGFGTGFLVAPGVVMTNHHVIASAEQARHAVAEFDYELDVRGEDRPVARFAVLADPAPLAHQPLDFCLVAVAPRAEDRRRGIEAHGFLPLSEVPGKAFVGEYLTIVQHPAGERKQVCVRENKLLRFDDAGDTLWYATDTVGGSSGSPVFNGSWQVVALHHSGIPDTDAAGNWLTVDGRRWDPSMDESRIRWKANEGIRVSRIVAWLRANAADHPLAREVLEHAREVSVTPLRTEAVAAAGDGLPRSEYADGELRLTFPVHVAVRLDAPGLAAGAGAHGHPAAPPPRPEPGGAQPGHSAPAPRPRAAEPQVEKVEVETRSYAERPGYDPSFLGGGRLRVPLPAPGRALAGQVLAKGRRPAVLDYWSYSVLMHRTRRLALVSAANVDAGRRPPGAGRDGDRWYLDPRVPEGAQLGPAFYGAQRTFEVDRTANPFDRGHLTRRLDAQWGDTAREAKRSGDDSFHYPNCAPQHWQFNQGSKRWLGLEDYVVEGLAGKGARACVLTGPVLDAPRSARDAEGRPVPRIRGAREPDPTFGEVAIPRLFWKVVACARPDGALAAAAFLMSQEDLLATVERLRGLPAPAEERLLEAEARLYQVAVADVAVLTGLELGPLAAADARGLEEALAGPRPIRSLTEVALAPRQPGVTLAPRDPGLPRTSRQPGVPLAPRRRGAGGVRGPRRNGHRPHPR